MITTEQKIAFERLEVAARQLGVSDDRFREISREVSAKAKTSLTWGTIDERLADLRRRIVLEFGNI